MFYSVKCRSRITAKLFCVCFIASVTNMFFSVFRWRFFRCHFHLFSFSFHLVSPSLDDVLMCVCLSWEPNNDPTEEIDKKVEQKVVGVCRKCHHYPDGALREINHSRQICTRNVCKTRAFSFFFCFFFVTRSLIISLHFFLRSEYEYVERRSRCVA